MRHAPRWLMALVLLAAAPSAFAEDRYVAIKLGDLPLTQGALPTGYKSEWTLPTEPMRPVARVDAPNSEAYVLASHDDGHFDSSHLQDAGALATYTLVVRAPADTTDITGKLLVPKADWSGMTTLAFKIPAAKASDAQKDFLAGKVAYFSALADRQLAGGAYFRRALRLAREDAGLKDDETPDATRTLRTQTIDETYSLFSGGRALAENLQLDRAFRRVTPKDQIKFVPLASIEGIKVQPFDWKERNKDLHPTLDPLASLIPQDQHALFFPSFAAFSNMLEEADQQSLPLLQLAEPRSENSLTKERYQRQLGLSMTEVGKILGPTLVNSVAITGSDPYLRLGADVAILFEAKGGKAEAEALQQAIFTQIHLNLAKEEGVRSGVEEAGTYAASFWKSADRTVSSYLSYFGNTVVVTNSPTQLAALAATFSKTTKSLVDAPEYTFFRNRYPRGDAAESALLILSDATIRRWGGPRLRIADARRTAALAVLTDMTAARMAGVPEKDALDNPYPDVDLGDLTATPAGIHSSLYNTLAFMTPLSEMSIDQVTEDEKAAYERWRDGYQNGYHQYFDPIAVRFAVNKKQLALDVTVMPLIANSDYNSNEFTEFTKGGHLKPSDGDPHDAPFHVIIAIDPKSKTLEQGNQFLGQMTGGLTNPLSWVGGYISLYADDNPFWQEMTKAHDPEAFVEKRYSRLPVALRIACNSPLKLAAFLTGMRGFSNQSAPNMTVWETRAHAGLSYVRISATANATADTPELKDLALYYAPTPDALVLSLSEPVIQHSLERYAASTQPAAAPVTPPLAAAAPQVPWLGDNTALHINRAAALTLWQSERKSAVAALQTLAWGNLPILNTLKHLHPIDDARALYTQLWQTRLTDPLGGSYIWNETDQTYESTTLGSPVTPKNPTTDPTYLQDFTQADFGLTLESDGLRARVSIMREK